MENESISVSALIAELDRYLHKNDYASAEQYLLRWREVAEERGDINLCIPVLNELMGLYRKLGREVDALECVTTALARIESAGIGEQVGSATTYLNCATVYKAFGKAEQGIELFRRARRIYEGSLAPDDSRLGGLYNNMALALVDVGRYAEADGLYRKAISVMERTDKGALEVAITYLNMASAAEAELGLEAAEDKIQEYLAIAEDMLEGYAHRDGYYAFVCEKCASVFGYYGHFFYEKELSERARRIYEGA